MEIVNTFINQLTLDGFISFSLAEMSCRNVRLIQQAWIAWRGQESLILTLGHGIENSLETLKDKGDLIVVIPGS